MLQNKKLNKIFIMFQLSYIGQLDILTKTIEENTFQQENCPTLEQSEAIEANNENTKNRTNKNLIKSDL